MHDKLYGDLKFLVDNWRSRCADADQECIVEFIAKRFEEAGGRIEIHQFSVNHQAKTGNQRDYKNVIASWGPESGPRIIVGAHYDVCCNPGADDNGSGIAGLLDLARKLGKENAGLKHRIDLAAFANEEPPFFGTRDMGSAHFARRIKEEKIKVREMICLEMIGYFSDSPGEHTVINKFRSFGITVPEHGDFIAVCGRPNDRAVEIATALNTEQPGLGFPVIAPRYALPEFELSDHASFWDNGFSAVMLTDTSFIRNPNYHEATDTIDTIDFVTMEKVIDGVFRYITPVIL